MLEVEMWDVVARHVTAKHPLGRHLVRSFKLRGFLPSLFLASKPVVYATACPSNAKGFLWLVRICGNGPPERVCYAFALLACTPALVYLHALSLFPSTTVLLALGGAFAAACGWRFTSLAVLHRSLPISLLFLTVFMILIGAFKDSGLRAEKFPASTDVTRPLAQIVQSSILSCSETIDSLQSSYGSLVAIK